MVDIKINMKIIVLSILIAAFMYPATLSYLLNAGKDISIAKKLSSSTLVNTRASIDPEKTKIVFMFDDGWSSVYSEAYKLMKQYDYKASVPIIPSRINKEDYMSYEQLSDLYLEGWDLLNHSYFHKENKYENSDELLSEFNKSRKWMNNRYIGRCSDMVVIPYGEINPYLIDQLKDDGYRSIRTSDNIIILDRSKIEYYPVTTINLLTNVPEYEVERLLEQSVYKSKTIILILHKIDDIDDGFGMTYNKDKFEQILMFIHENSDKFQVIIYSQLFE